MMPRVVLLLELLCLSLLETSSGCGLDPEVYRNLFENNMPMFKEISRLVVESNASSVLDLGTGPGEPATLIARGLPTSRVVATDLQEGMLEKARARARGLENVDFKVASADDLSAFPSGSMDAVSMSYVLMFVPDSAKSISEIARVLRPGGRAYIAVWKKLSMYAHNLEVLEKMGRKPAPLPINPMSLSADNAVENIVKGVPTIVPKFSTMLSYSFLLPDDASMCAAAMLTAGTEVKKLAEAGFKDAEAKFCELLLESLSDAGYQTEVGAWEAGDNSAQLLVLHKSSKTEL